MMKWEAVVQKLRRKAQDPAVSEKEREALNNKANELEKKYQTIGKLIDDDLVEAPPKHDPLWEWYQPARNRNATQEDDGNWGDEFDDMDTAGFYVYITKRRPKADPDMDHLIEQGYEYDPDR
jgi:hypothetical protein